MQALIKLPSSANTHHITHFKEHCTGFKATWQKHADEVLEASIQQPCTGPCKVSLWERWSDLFEQSFYRSQLLARRNRLLRLFYRCFLLCLFLGPFQLVSCLLIDHTKVSPSVFLCEPLLVPAFQLSVCTRTMKSKIAKLEGRLSVLKYADDMIKRFLFL